MLERQEAAVIRKSHLNSELRFESEFFKKRYLVEDTALSRWPIVQIGDFAYVTDGQHGYHVVDETSPIVMLTAKNAKDWFSNRDEADPIAKWVDNNNKRSSLEAGDIILSTRGTVGFCAIVIEETLPANIDQDVARISWPGRDRFLPEFIVAYLNSSFGQDHFVRHASGMVQHGLPLKKVREIPIPLLSPVVQSRVAEIVNEALRLQRESYSDKSHAEQILLQALGLDGWQPPEPLSYTRRASEAFAVGRLDAEYFNPGAAEISRILVEKGAIELRMFARVGTGFPWSSDYFVQDHSEPGEPFVRIRDCKPGSLDPVDLDRLDSNYANNQCQEKAQTSDLVLGMDGLKWFYASLLLGPCFINQRVAHIQRLSEAPISSEFLLVCINSVLGQKQLLRAMTIAHTVGHITLEDVRSLLIPDVTPKVHDEITFAVKKSFASRRKAYALLDRAKRAVEIAIEQGEASALVFLNESITEEY
jgi:hypothetical protein